MLQVDHDKFGDELFEVDAARYNVVHLAEDGVWELVIHVTTSAERKRHPELKNLVDGTPNLEATLVVGSEQPTLAAGGVFSQAAGYDYERDENLALFYYFAHGAVERYRFQVDRVDGDALTGIFKGEAVVNGYGPETDAKLTVTATFARDPDLRRSFG